MATLLKVSAELSTHTHTHTLHQASPWHLHNDGLRKLIRIPFYGIFVQSPVSFRYISLPHGNFAVFWWDFWTPQQKSTSGKTGLIVITGIDFHCDPNFVIQIVDLRRWPMLHSIDLCTEPRRLANSAKIGVLERYGFACLGNLKLQDIPKLCCVKLMDFDGWNKNI